MSKKSIDDMVADLMTDAESREDEIAELRNEIVDLFKSANAAPLVAHAAMGNLMQSVIESMPTDEGAAMTLFTLQMMGMKMVGEEAIH